MKSFVTILAVCLALTAAAQAERILLDIGDAANPAGTGWNSFASNPNWGSSGDVYVSQGSVVDDSGAAVAGASWGVSNIDDVRGAAAGGAALAGYPTAATEDFVQSNVDGDASGPTSWNAGNQIIISGLSGAAYNVSIYSSRVDTNRNGFFRINGGTPVAIDAVPGTYYTFADIAPAAMNVGGVDLSNAIKVEFWGNAAAGATAELNFVELNAVAVPEPATMGLLLIGGLLGLRRRRA